MRRLGMPSASAMVLVILTGSVLVVAMAGPTFATPGHRGPPVEHRTYQAVPIGDPCGSFTSVHLRWSGMLQAMMWDNRCNDHLVTSFQVYLRDGRKTAPLQIVVPPATTTRLGWDGLRQLGIRGGTAIVGPGEIVTLADGPPEGSRTGYHLIDADGRLHDHSRPWIRQPLEARTDLGVTPGSWVVNADEGTGVITSMELGNPFSTYAHHVFEVIYPDGTWSQPVHVVTPPHSEVTMDRGVLSRLGIGSAIGIEVLLRDAAPREDEPGDDEPGDDEWGDNLTVLDEDGNVEQLPSRHRPG